MMLIPPIYEHRTCFHIFVSSSIFFFSVLQFSEYRSLTSLDRIIPSYFILFGGIVSEIVFLISLSDSSLLVYKNATDFLILILYPATLHTRINSKGIKDLNVRPKTIKILEENIGSKISDTACSNIFSDLSQSRETK